MKSIKFIILLSFLISGCRSSEKLLQKGEYDAVIERSIKNILKGKADDDDKLLLNKSYKLANQKNTDRIHFLKTENKPENWEEIYQHYNALNIRQNEIQKVLPLVIGKKKINYEYIDYSGDIVEAKTNVAKFYYHKGLDNMNLQTKESYRQAYFDFQKVKEYRANDYPKLNTLIQDAKYFGTSRVLVEAVNISRVRLPDDFYDNLLRMDIQGLNNTWIEYYFGPLQNEMEYDYFVAIKLRNILVTPDEFSRREFIRTKEIRDGFEYELDRRGNVIKDSLGNDVKVPKYRQLSCKVIETKQFKTATINGVVEYKSVSPKNIMKTEPVAATSIFEHLTARAYGDLEALQPSDRELLRVEIVPFPDDLSMIYDCSEILKQAVHDVIYDNRRLIK